MMFVALIFLVGTVGAGNQTHHYETFYIYHSFLISYSSTFDIASLLVFTDRAKIK